MSMDNEQISHLLRLSVAVRLIGSQWLVCAVVSPRVKFD